MSTYKWLKRDIAIFQQDNKAPCYPPFDVISLTDEDQTNPARLYKINVAVAGIHPHEISVELDLGFLSISKKQPINDNIQPMGEYFYRGISNRNFCLRFMLTKNVQVKNVVLINGILTINLLKLVTNQTRRVFFVEVGDMSPNQLDEIKSSISSQ
jgi:molecular chaperone IbpA